QPPGIRTAQHDPGGCWIEVPHAEDLPATALTLVPVLGRLTGGGGDGVDRILRIVRFARIPGRYAIAARSGQGRGPGRGPRSRRRDPAGRRDTVVAGDVAAAPCTDLDIGRCSLVVVDDHQ